MKSISLDESSKLVFFVLTVTTHLGKIATKSKTVTVHVQIGEFLMKEQV